MILLGRRGGSAAVTAAASARRRLVPAAALTAAHCRWHSTDADAFFGGPGSVPAHNVHLFVCGATASNAASGLRVDLRFSQLANEVLQEAAVLHDEAEQGSAGSSGISWSFGLSMCECPLGCEPGDMLLFPHYLHLRPTEAASKLHSSSLGGVSPALLAAVAALQPQEGRQVGEATQWADPDAEEEDPALVEVISTLRHHSHTFIWGPQGGAGLLQSELMLQLSGQSAAKPSEVMVLQCSAPLTADAAPDGAGEEGGDGAAVGVAVFAAQSREYATWGAGVGEWFGSKEGDGERAALASKLASFLVTTHDAGGGPYMMNALAHVMGGAWRGRLGLGQEEAEGIYQHFS